MRDERRNYIAVGLFVVTTSILGIIWIAMLSGQTGATDRYSIRYESVVGLRPGTQIYFQGFPIGIVERIEARREDVGASEMGMFEITVDVERGWPIPSDSVAEISANGLLSAVVIDIQRGEAATLLEPGDRIKSAEPTSLMAVVSEAASGMSEFLFNDLRPQLESLVSNMDATVELVQAFVGPENAANAAKILGNLNSVSEETRKLVIGLDSTRSQLDQVVGRVDTMIDANDEDIRTSISDLQQTIEALARRSDALATNLEETTRNASEFSRQIRNNPGVLLRGREAGGEAEQ